MRRCWTFIKREIPHKVESGTPPVQGQQSGHNHCGGLFDSERRPVRNLRRPQSGNATPDHQGVYQSIGQLVVDWRAYCSFWHRNGACSQCRADQIASYSHGGCRSARPWRRREHASGRSTKMKFAATILALFLSVGSLMAADSSSRFESVGGKIMCSCGCGQMLLKCNHVGCPNSATMIRQLHEQVAATDDDQAVLNFFRREWGVTAVVE